ncbi:hypothetical protein KZC56_17500 [Microbacterium sp. SSW1-47]|uniref:hypothetical protein n=1 Tax=Microbacterium sufflavum TaxID=2851649 RepID=UPI001FFC7C76|nr:hypothetical protein [Microbacterium sufflavum]MCK2028096.1 hypothetical protein [Microbacterium sufflavum]
MAGSNRFEIDGVLNASGIAKGAKDGEKALSDLQDAVGDVADESGRAGGKVDSFASKLVDASRKAGKSDDDIKDALRSMGLSAKQAERAVEEIGDEFTETGREGDRAGRKLEDSLKDVQRQAERAADDVGDVGGKGFGKLSDGAKEVTQEIGQNFGEAVSSIRDNLGDLGQVGQDTLGGLAATLAGTGPTGLLGAAALGAGAVGLGLVTAELQKQQEAADEMRRRISAAYRGAAEDGRAFIDTQQIIAEGLDLIFNPDRADEYKKAVQDANTLGIDLSDIIAGANGDLEAQRVIQEQINALLADASSYEATGTTNRKTLKGDVAEIRDRWREITDTTQEFNDKLQVGTSYQSEMLLRMVEDAGAAQEEVDALGNKLITIQTEHGQVQVVIDAETGQATQNLAKFQGDADGVIASVNGKQVVLRARAAVDEAQRQLDGFVTRNNGREIRVRGRLTVDSGGTGWD